MNDELKTSIDRFFDLMEERLHEDLEEASDENGMMPAAEADRLLAKYFNGMFDQLMKDSGNADPGRRELLRRELEPCREMLAKTIRDRLRPH
jgi:hypothetical protein